MNRNGGLLIVNADDWGYNPETTEAIADVFEAGGLTSTTAMTFMTGSRDAADRATQHPGLGIGLHLNLFEEYSDPETPMHVLDRQRRLIHSSRSMRLRRWTYNPSVRHEIDRIIADQYDSFIELYGRHPTHVDGHHHSHLAANVLLSRVLPRETKIRNALSDAHHRNPVTDALRFVRRKLINRRYSTTDHFFSISTVWPGWKGKPCMDKLGLSRLDSVEVMVHPAFADQYEPLRSRLWVETLRQLPTGTFADL